MSEDIFFINSINKNKNINSNSEYIESSFTKDLTTDYYNKYRDTYKPCSRPEYGRKLTETFEQLR